MGRNKNISDEELQLRKIFEKKMHLLMSSLQIKNDIDVYRDTTISQERFSNLINQKATPSVLELSQLASKYNLPLDYFLNENNNTTTINWRSWTFRDIFTMLLEMEEARLIGFDKCVYSYYETYTVSGYPDLVEVERNAVYSIDAYLSQKITEWKNLEQSISTSELKEDILPFLKETFINKIKDVKFYPELPPFSDDDDVLPF